MQKPVLRFRWQNKEVWLYLMLVLADPLKLMNMTNLGSLISVGGIQPSFPQSRPIEMDGPYLSHSHSFQWACSKYR